MRCAYIGRKRPFITSSLRLWIIFTGLPAAFDSFTASIT